MATKNSRKKESWWQTFPGVLTAVAGLITAIAGLVVALKNPAANESLPSLEKSTASGAERKGDASRAGGTIPAVPGESGRGAVAMNAEAGFNDGAIVMTVVAARWEPVNVEKRALRLKVRWTNHRRTDFARTYYWTFRLLVEGVPRAPSVAPSMEQVEAQSVKELDYVFEVPAAVKKFVLRISSDEETRDIPIDMTTAL